MAKKKPNRSAPRRKAASRARAPRGAAARKTMARGKERRGKGPQTLRVRAFEPTFTVDDVERSERFYTQVIGFVVDQRWTEGGKVQGLLLKAGNSRLGLAQDDWAQGRDRKKGVGFSLWCETEQDVDALAMRIKGAGGQLIDGPKEEPGLGRYLTVEDPDRFRLRIYRRV
jgi:predicted enzyme related to lactoylglutathione lyase